MLRTTFCMLLLGCLTPALPQTVIKMGTLAPDGSPWHMALQSIGERWRKISGGQVDLRIYAGGKLGDEPDMVNKMRIGQIQAAGLSGAGLSGIEPGVMALQIPMMFDTYTELDYVRERVAPRLEKMIEARGFLVLNWGDVGWVHFFTTRPVTRLADMRSMKLFTWAGDTNDTLELWKANGFRAVPLAATDILMGLQTGLIDAVPTTPLYALLGQSFATARNMIDVKWAPLIGATLVSRRTWDSLPAGQRSEMMKAAREAGEGLRGGIRKMGDEAVATMEKRRLNVIHVDAATVAEWRKEAEGVYPKLRGGQIPAELFDQVRNLRDECRGNSSLDSVTMDPVGATGGSAATLTINLTRPAPPCGVVVVLAGGNTAFPLPPSITVAASAKSASVSVRPAVTASTKVTVTATYNSVTRTATATVMPVPPPARPGGIVTPAAAAGAKK